MNVLTILGIVLFAACGQDDNRPAQTLDETSKIVYTADSVWVQVRPEMANAKIAMPLEPEYKKTEFDNVVKDQLLTIHQYQATVNDGSAVFIFVYHDIDTPITDPRAIKKTLDGAVGGAKAAIFGSLVMDEKTRIRKNPGRKFEIRAEQNGRVLKFSGQVLLVGQRMYQMTFIMDEKAFDTRMRDKFFNSFDLVAPAKDLPPKPEKSGS